MTYFGFPHISELSLTRGRRRSAFWPSPLNHTRRSGSFITVTIISISLTHKSCHKSTGISFCDNMHDQCTGGGGGSSAAVAPSVVRVLTVKVFFMNQQTRNVFYGARSGLPRSNQMPSSLVVLLSRPYVFINSPPLACCCVCTTKHHPPTHTALEAVSVSSRGWRPRETRRWQVRGAASDVDCATRHQTMVPRWTASNARVLFQALRSSMHCLFCHLIVRCVCAWVGIPPMHRALFKIYTHCGLDEDVYMDVMSPNCFAYLRPQKFSRKIIN